MAIFHFPQYEHELFCWYFKRLNAFLAQCEYYVGKWEILGIVDEEVNSETRILLQFWDFHRLNVDDTWSFCFYGLHGIRLNLKRLVMFIVIHFPIHVYFMLNHIMLLCGVICVILLPIMLAHVLFMLVMLI